MTDEVDGHALQEDERRGFDRSAAGWGYRVRVTAKLSLLLTFLALSSCAEAPISTAPTAPSQRVSPASLPASPALSAQAGTSESDPRTWTARLEDPAQRASAVKRLAESFDDALSSSTGPPAARRDDENVRKLVDLIVEPLARAYDNGGFDEESRKGLMKLLADMEDPRAARAFAKAFRTFEPGKTDDDLRYASQGTTRLAQAGHATDPRLVTALWDCFVGFAPSRNTRSINLVKDLQSAVLAVRDPSYGAKAVELLAVPVLDPKDPAESLDKIQFWQLTAVRLIGDLKLAAGVKPLVRALMTPEKRDLAVPLRLALTKMPKESEPVLIAALAGTDPELAALAARYPDKGSVPLVAEPLAYISRGAGREAILTALAMADNDTNRAVLAIALTHFPRDARTVKAYLEAYRKVPADATVPLLGGANAHAVIARSAASFFDPSLTEWLLKESAAATGEAADELPPAALAAAIRLTSTSSAKAVRDAVGKMHGVTIEKDMYASAAAVLARCKQNAACYVRFLDTPVPQASPSAKMGHVKAAWMAAIYGNATTRGELVARVDSVKDGAVRIALVDAIADLAPEGDAAAAATLDAIVDHDLKAGVSYASEEVSKVALRLRSRVP